MVRHTIRLFLCSMIGIALTNTACSRRSQLQCKNIMTIIQPTIDSRALMGEGFWASSYDYKTAESSLKDVGITEPPLRNLRSHLTAAYRTAWQSEEALLQFKGANGGIKLTGANQGEYAQYVAAKQNLKKVVTATQDYCTNNQPIAGLTDRAFQPPAPAR
jgi:hypothetical protein